jgi:exodeoxyribonuclease VII large subunit
VVPRTDAKAPAQVEAFAPGAPKPPAAEVTAPPVAAPVAAVPPPPAAAAVPPPAVLSGPVAHAAKPVAEAPKPVAEALRPAARTEAAGASLRKEYPWRTQGAPVAAEAEKPRRVVLSVGELTRQIKDAIEGGFPRVVVRGEVSSFRGANVRGHLYFTLKDQEACLDAKIWASTAARMKFRLREGMEVIAEGSIDLYEPQGRYSLIIQRLEPAGEGALALAFQQLKEKLQAEGLFGDKRIRPPRPLPLLPRRIGVVTSRTGAALQDFLRVLHGRHPRLSVLVCDARVQGEGSAQEVVSAIQRLARTDVDVIVVTRGGGSMEDLWTFNEEIVARAIHACPIPVVSAIGHEVDFTIADFVADLRAPTPSAAAERLAPVLKDLELGLATSERRLHKAAERAVLLERQRLRAVAGRLPDPRRLLAQRRLHLGAQHDKLERGTRQGLRQGRDRLRALVDRLNRLRPQAQLAANREALHRLKARLQAAGRELLRRRREALSRSSKILERASPMSGLQRKHKALHAAKARLVELQRRRLHSERHDFSRKVATLQALSPLEVMARGYSVTFRRSDGHLVRGAADVKVGDSIAVRLLTPGCSTLSGCDEIDATVTSVKGSPGGNEPPS